MDAMSDSKSGGGPPQPDPEEKTGPVYPKILLTTNRAGWTPESTSVCIKKD
jgi:hypothetical protein